MSPPPGSSCSYMAVDENSCAQNGHPGKTLPYGFPYMSAGSLRNFPKGPLDQPHLSLGIPKGFCLERFRVILTPICPCILLFSPLNSHISLHIFIPKTILQVIQVNQRWAGSPGRLFLVQRGFLASEISDVFFRRNSWVLLELGTSL